MHAGAILSENFVEHRVTADAKKIHLDERIFLLKSIHDLLALAQSHRRPMN